MQAIVVAHGDRLMRSAAEYVEAALSAQGRKLIVLERSEVKDDLVQDKIEVLTSFCARVYGRRSARNQAKKSNAGHRAVRLFHTRSTSYI